MRLMRFTARDAREAVKKAREELGPEAVIMQAVAVRPKGLARLWRRPWVEVLAAVDDERSLPRAAMGAHSDMPADGAAHTRVGRAAQDQVEGGQNAILERLRAQGVDSSILERLRRAGAHDLREAAAHLRALLPPCRQLAANGGRQVVALLGATGVGKTTTVAKLAALVSQQRQELVGLVTADTFRVGAADQLQRYAQLLGLPFRAAYSPGELTEAIASLASCQLVLVDMPGCSPRNSAATQELHAYLDAVQNGKRLLVVDAGSHVESMRCAAGALSSAGWDGLIVTKLDEAALYGPIFSFAVEFAQPLYYFCTGQRVPEDLEPATADRLLAMLLGEQPVAAPTTQEFVHLPLQALAKQRTTALYA